MTAAPIRHAQPEVMDDPSLPRTRHEHALRGLERINTISRSAASFIPALRRATMGKQAVRILDVATGSGDVAVALARSARRMGLEASLGLCDISPTALELAAARAAGAGVAARAIRLDATRDAIPEDAAGRYDLAICSLFFHHLDAEACARVLALMARASRVVAVNDLRRCRSGTALAWLGSRLLTRSDVVHTDAVISAQAAWTTEEFRGMARQAGLHGASIRHVFPFRMMLTWEGP
ncbi:MAG: methyltransferase domain-containing protein [Phycisphaerales bacterium]